MQATPTSFLARLRGALRRLQGLKRRDRDALAILAVGVGVFVVAFAIHAFGWFEGHQLEDFWSHEVPLLCRA